MQEDVLALKGDKGKEVPFYQTLQILTIRSVEPQPLTMQDYAGNRKISLSLSQYVSLSLYLSLSMYSCMYVGM